MPGAASNLVNQFNAFAKYQQAHSYIPSKVSFSKYDEQLSERGARLFKMVYYDTACAYVDEKTMDSDYPERTFDRSRIALCDILENADKAHASNIAANSGGHRLTKLSAARAAVMKENVEQGLAMMRGKRKVIWGNQDKIADVFARCTKLMMTPEHIADGDSKQFLTPHVYACKWRDIKRHMGGIVDINVSACQL